jgi:hypothetical protein
MTPDEAYTAMQGQGGGVGMGLTTYPDSADPVELENHASCETLEGDGRAVRHLDAVVHAPSADASAGQRFVIWMPVEAPPPPEGEGFRRR